MNDKPFIHQATPRKLKSEFRKVRYKFHPLAKRLGINVRYVHDIIKHGIEPSNPNIRVKLFLPKKPRAPIGSKKHTYTEPSPPLKWWRSITKERRRQYIAYCFINFSEPQDAERYSEFAKQAA